MFLLLPLLHSGRAHEWNVPPSWLLVIAWRTPIVTALPTAVRVTSDNAKLKTNLRIIVHLPWTSMEASSAAFLGVQAIGACAAGWAAPT